MLVQVLLISREASPSTGIPQCAPSASTGSCRGEPAMYAHRQALQTVRNRTPLMSSTTSSFILAVWSPRYRGAGASQEQVTQVVDLLLAR